MRTSLNTPTPNKPLTAAINAGLGLSPVMARRYINITFFGSILGFILVIPPHRV